MLLVPATQVSLLLFPTMHCLQAHHRWIRPAKPPVASCPHLVEAPHSSMIPGHGRRPCVPTLDIPCSACDAHQCANHGEPGQGMACGQPGVPAATRQSLACPAQGHAQPPSHCTPSRSGHPLPLLPSPFFLEQGSGGPRLARGPWRVASSGAVSPPPMAAGSKGPSMWWRGLPAQWHGQLVRGAQHAIVSSPCSPRAASTPSFMPPVSLRAVPGRS